MKKIKIIEFNISIFCSISLVPNTSDFSFAIFVLKLLYMVALKTYNNFFVLLLSFSLILWNCSSSEVIEKPSLSFSKMAEVLADVHLLEGELQGINKIEKDSVANLYYYYIFKLHNVKEADFYQSLDFYTKNPDLYEKLYSATADSIGNKKVMEK